MAYRVRVVPKKKRRMMQQGGIRKTTSELPVTESSLTYPLVREHIFCGLPESVLAELEEISSPSTYSKDAILFVEGQESRGAFVICNGRVKLSTGSSRGKSFMVRMAEAGEVVGLPGTISGKPYELTAQALEPLQANFIPREAFLQFLRQRGEAAVTVAGILSRIYQATLSEVRYLGLSASTAEKLARFLLDLPAKPIQGNGHIQATLTLTHKEIGEMIGASRETVTRLFASFRHERLVRVLDSTVIIANKAGLEKLLDA
ncbi:MAG TPA: Crp/Fnr family transcriptional regulator [Candidatus Acidoferrum sp.]|nr:Crp/Fnr family transcriptional regulator [Candidatus Acidoferrum sp.]